MVPYGNFATHATHGVSEETVTSLPLATISTSRLKRVDLAFYSTIKIDKNNQKREKGILVEMITPLGLYTVSVNFQRNV